MSVWDDISCWIKKLLGGDCDEEGGVTPPTKVFLRGQVVEIRSDGRKRPVKGVRVATSSSSFQGYMVTAADGMFMFREIPSIARRQLTVRKHGYETITEFYDNTFDLNTGQIVIKNPESVFDFENTRLAGWYDFSMPWFYTGKYQGVIDDIKLHGANSVAINAVRSWGFEYHDGNCDPGPKGKGWWKRIVEGGWNREQFGDEFESPFENIHESSEVNVKWLDQVEDRVRRAQEAGLWALVTLWCPYDTKWFGIPWYFWIDDCSKSPYTTYCSWCLHHEEIATTALLERLKDYGNVIINDNWEESGWHGSVNLEWKKFIFDIVQRTMPGVPYYVYVGDNTEDVPSVVDWINREPLVTGLHSHYRLGDDHASYGLQASKRILSTEEMSLSLNDVIRGLNWMIAGENRDMVMYVGEYRDYMNPEGSSRPDDRAGDRARLYPEVERLLGQL